MTELPFKAVAVDVDGTFENDKKQYDHTMFGEILYRLHKNNAHFIIASGRPAERLRGDFYDFSDEVDFVADNGAVLVRDGQIIHTTTFSRKGALHFIHYLQQHYPKAAKNALISGVKHSYFLSSRNEALKNMLYFYYPNSLEIDNFDKIPTDDQYTKIAISYTNKIRSDLEYGFNFESNEKIRATTSGWSDIDIVRQGVNKATGLAKFLDYLQLSPEQLIAFGDGENDIEMLKFAGLSYAMANGQAEVKKAAKFIAPSNNDNGVFKILNHYLNQALAK